mmetsp:Transcript_13815/g.54765  ORF Transcript_13815/g.54765 Transcript_13815/m.54765 type:complete len:201 (-) Transcript_13815:77-679(-)
MLTQQHVCGLSTALPPRLTSRASLRGARAVTPSKALVSRRGRANAVVVKAEDTNWGRELSSAVVRVGAGVLMVHNGLDKLVDPEGFAKFVVEPYLGFLPHDEPLSFVTWTYLAAAAELAGAAGLTLGFLTRLSALSLFSTMGLAVYFHIAQSGLEGFPLGVVEKHQYAYEPAALYCLIYFYFVVNGGGALSLDNALKKDD